MSESSEVTNIFDLEPVDDERWLTLEHPSTGEPVLYKGKPMQIGVISVSSKKGKAVQGKHDLQRRKLLQRTRGKGDPAAENVISISMLADLTTGFRNIPTGDDNLLEYTRENAIGLYRRVEWIKNAVDVFAGDTNPFLKEPVEPTGDQEAKGTPTP